MGPISQRERREGERGACWAAGADGNGSVLGRGWAGSVGTAGSPFFSFFSVYFFPISVFQNTFKIESKQIGKI